jgi:hypothetical protein
MQDNPLFEDVLPAFDDEITLPGDKDQLLISLDSALAQGRDAFRPEAWRGL